MAPTHSSSSDDDDDESRPIEPTASLFSGPMVKVLVGPSQQRWDLHQNMLSATADFFKKAFSGPWKESQGEIELPVDDPKAFALFVGWMYMKYSTNTEATIPPVRLDTGGLAHTKLYVFARKYLIDELANCVVDCWLSFLYDNAADVQQTHLTGMPYLFANTDDEDPMRALFAHGCYLHLFVHHRKPPISKWWEGIFEQCHGLNWLVMQEARANHGKALRNIVWSKALREKFQVESETPKGLIGGRKS